MIQNTPFFTIFIHIPKAGGQTLKSIIRKNFNKNEIFFIMGDNVKQSAETFLALAPNELKKLRLLMGHMHFGLHHKTTQTFQYVTMFREPVSRICSHYNYAIRTPNHYLHELILKHKISLSDYVSSGITHETRNGQTFMIAGIDPRDFSQQNPKEVLDIAKQNLQSHFSFAGIIEKFDESLLLMKKRLDINNIFYIKLNTSVGLKNHLNLEIENNIKEYNKLDIELYNHANNILDEQIIEYGGNFKNNLVKFRKLNKLYSYYGKPKQSIYKSLRRILNIIMSRP